MDYNQTKNYLKEYRDKYDRVQYINARMQNVKSVSFEERLPKGPPKSINELIQEKYVLLDEMHEIEQVIMSISEFNVRMVLIYKYLEFRTLEYIAEKCMHYSLRQIKKFHSEGIKRVSSNYSGRN